MPYREGGWTLRQVVHHLADSHSNGYLRFKLALTEDVPTIVPYDEKAWAETPDVALTNPDVSVRLMTSLHERWVDALRALNEDDARRTFVHPERGTLDIDWLIQMYAWHGRHHIAHVAVARQRGGW